jgi:hypothetical protein
MDAEAALRQRLPSFSDRIHRLGITPNIDIIPINKTSARQTLREQCGWAEETDIIACFGFLHPVKGLEMLLPVF